MINDTLPSVGSCIDVCFVLIFYYPLDAGIQCELEEVVVRLQVLSILSLLQIALADT
jgi:hypothetical protein